MEKHVILVAGGGRGDIPGSLQVSIAAVEQLLAALKEKLQ
jgi:hypothetical protein